MPFGLTMPKLSLSRSSAAPATAAAPATGGGLADPLADPLTDPLSSHKMGFGEKFSEAGAKLFRTKKAGSTRQEKVAAVIKDIQDLTAQGRTELLMRRFRPVLEAHMAKEMNTEALLFIDAVEAGTDQATLNAEYLDDGSPHMINLSSRQRADAQAGDLDGSVREMKKLIGGDVWGRLHRSEEFKAVVAAEL